MSPTFKFHKGFSTLDVATTRKLTRTAKEVLERYLENPNVIKGLFRMQTKHFFRIIDFKYAIAEPGVKVQLEGLDTGKDIYTAVFKQSFDRNANNVLLHWILVRGLKNDFENNLTIFYEESSTEEET